jgi:hypothetical protein
LENAARLGKEGETLEIQLLKEEERKLKLKQEEERLLKAKQVEERKALWFAQEKVKEEKEQKEKEEKEEQEWGGGGLLTSSGRGGWAEPTNDKRRSGHWICRAL